MSAALLLQPLKTSSFKMSGVRCQNFGQDARRCSCPASHAAAPLRQFFAEQLGASWRIDRFLDASPSSTTAIPLCMCKSLHDLSIVAALQLGLHSLQSQNRNRLRAPLHTPPKHVKSCCLAYSFGFSSGGIGFMISSVLQHTNVIMPV